MYYEWDNSEKVDVTVGSEGEYNVIMEKLMFWNVCVFHALKIPIRDVEFYAVRNCAEIFQGILVHMGYTVLQIEVFEEREVPRNLNNNNHWEVKVD